MRFLSAIAASLLILSSFAAAETLTLFNPVTTVPYFQGYSDSINLSPAFHVLQNDLELKDYATQNIFQNDGLKQVVTDLCIPSSLADLLLYQYASRPTLLSNLKIPGVTPGSASVDGADVVKGLIQQCGFNPDTKQNPNEGISWVEAADCLSALYTQSGYNHASIQYIRKNQFGSKSPNVTLTNRDPTLSDILSALRSGKEVIGIIDFTKTDANGNGTIVGSHSFNIFGYGANATEPDSIAIYLQNSNRLYNMDFTTQVFDVAQLNVNSNGSPVPLKASSIELTTLQGRLLNFQGQQTFLSGLVIIQPE